MMTPSTPSHPNSTYQREPASAISLPSMKRPALRQEPVCCESFTKINSHRLNWRQRAIYKAHSWCENQNSTAILNPKGGFSLVSYWGAGESVFLCPTTVKEVRKDEVTAQASSFASCCLCCLASVDALLCTSTFSPADSRTVRTVDEDSSLVNPLKQRHQVY